MFLSVDSVYTFTHAPSPKRSAFLLLRWPNKYFHGSLQEALPPTKYFSTLSLAHVLCFMLSLSHRMFEIEKNGSLELSHFSAGVIEVQ